MKMYVLLLVFLAIFVPMTIKYKNMENALTDAQTKPCIINLHQDDNPFKSNNINDGWSEKLKLNPIGGAASIDRNFGHENPFSSDINPNSRQQPEWNYNNESNATDESSKRVGKTCNFGLCLPGN